MIHHLDSGGITGMSRRVWRGFGSFGSARMWKQVLRSVQQNHQILREYSQNTLGERVLLHAQVHYGGVVIGTDMSPNNPDGFFDQMRTGRSFLIQDKARCVYNGMSFASSPWDPRFTQVLEHIRLLPERFHETQVPSVTGPLRWTSVMHSMDHDLDLIGDRIAWTRFYWEREITRPAAWVHPGFAASHARR